MPEEARAALEAVTIDRVKQFDKDYYGASNAGLSVIGDFDPGRRRKRRCSAVPAG
jgi:zinc protease